MLSSQYINEIKAIRKSIGMSQKELSQLTGIPQSTLSYMESHSTPVKLDEAKKLADSLNMTVVDVLERILDKEDIKNGNL